MVEETQINEVTKDVSNIQLNETNKQYDSEIVEFSIKFKNIYENSFEQHLRGLAKNTPIYGSRLPNDDDNEDEVDSTILFYFNRLEFDTSNKDIIEFVIVNSFDRSEEYKFHRIQCNNYGPYLNTYLWCFNYCTGRDKDDESKEYFLDLPASLYRLIEE